MHAAVDSDTAGLTDRKLTVGGVSVSSADLVAMSRGGHASGYGSSGRPKRRSSSVGSSYSRRKTLSRARWICREDFDRRFAEHNPPPEDTGGIGYWQWKRGRETRWIAYRALFRLSRSRGTALHTTNAQTVRRLEKARLSRCERTAQRVHQDLMGMGIVVVRHVHRGGSTPGFRDCLHLRLVDTYVTPSVRTDSPEQAQGESGPKTASAAPASPADDGAPPRSGGASAEEIGSGEVSELSDRGVEWFVALLAEMGITEDG